MSHKLISSIWALAFLVVIQVSSPVFRFMLPAMALYIAGLLAYNYWYLHKHNFFSFWSWLRPLFFLAAMVGLYMVIPANADRGFFLLAAIAMIYFLETYLLAASEQIVFLETLVAYFGLALGVFGLNFYLLPQNTWTLLLLALITFCITRASFDYIPQSRQNKNFFSLLIAFSVLELSWGLIFLPLHFTAMALILFNIYYVLWIVVYYYLFHNLNSKKITFHVIFAFIIIVLTFLVTPWKL